MKTIWQRLFKQNTSSQDGNTNVDVDTIREYENLIANTEKVSFKYVAEGRANVVYSIWEETSDSRGRFEGTLLRVPKATPGVTPCDYEALQEFHTSQVQRHVGHQYLVPQVLIQISAEVAGILHGLRGRRDESEIRAGHAMLVQDMSESPGYMVLEFKPKWLAQSPLAPAHARRCRTCAYEALRKSQKQAKGHAASTRICPLGLVHEDPVVVTDTVKRLAQDWTARDQRRLADAFETSGILKKLRELQMKGDPGRALMDCPSDPAFGLAMTLRDCSCFVRMPMAPDKAVEIKIADVDKKNWEEKQTYWQDLHRSLIDNGWYTCEEAGTPIATKCVLS